MVIVPLIMSSIIVGVAGIGNPASLGRIGIKTLGYYFMTSLFAILIGLTMSNLIQPGVGADIPLDIVSDQFENLKTPGSLGEVVIRMIPINPVSAAANGDMLGIIFFSLIFGIALTMIQKKYRDILLPIADAFFGAMMKITELVIQLLPFGVFGLILNTLNNLDASGSWGYITNIMWYMLTIAGGLLIHMLVVLPILLKVFAKKSFSDHFRHMANAMLTAFSTSSSSATLPVTIECVEKNAKVSNRISSFVIPMGATVNMDGTALYECAGVLFIAQVLGVDLSFGYQMVVVMTALLASIGAAGIPSAGLVMIFIVLDAVGLKGDSVNAIVLTMLAVDRPLDMMRTMVNVFSDSVGAVTIAASENEIGDFSET